MLIGEMSALVLMSQKCSSQKIEKFGFKYQFENLTNALKDIYAKA
jgi:NAD dependent epimerase/dehydratase family enzyme